MINARDFTNRLLELLRHERAAMADFLVALADFDRQKLWLELGHASLFSFLRRELGLSAGAAQYRKTAAELVQRFPDVEAALRSGRLCLSSVIELGKVITAENAAELLPRFFGLSSREAAAVAVSIRPVQDPPRRDIVTSLPMTAPRSTPSLEREQAPAPATEHASASSLRAPEIPAPDEGPTLAIAAAARPAAAGRSEAIEPLDAETSRLHVTVSRRFLSKLDRVKDALSHARPGAGAAEAIEACMDLLLAQNAKRKGLVEKPRATARPAKFGAIPAAVKRYVWRRAGGRCEWPLEAGGVCGSTLRTEFDHVIPRARGGLSTIENVRLLCRVHNQIAARNAFGDAWMDRFGRRRSEGDEARPRASEAGRAGAAGGPERFGRAKRPDEYSGAKA